MPESVTDRPTSSYEHVFLLTKAARYFYDAEAIREDADKGRAGKLEKTFSTSDPANTLRGDIGRAVMRTEFRNSRNVWTIPTQPNSLAHFAMMPAELAERCIRAGSRAGDTVLDPFAGAGTTALVADRLQRHAIGIELNPANAVLARGRILDDAGLFGDVA
jgi:DNA modification methylase